jgi:HEAT repeat protein
MAMTALVLLAAGCGGGPRASVVSAIDARDVTRSLDEYDRFREDEGGGDPELLGAVAALVLERAVTDGEAEERDAALHQLALAGTAGEAVLERLAESAEDRAVRARALGVLASRGRSSAHEKLRAMVDDDDPAVVAEAVHTLDGATDTARLLALLTHTAGEVRAAAAKELGDAAPDGAVFVALAEAARVDPLPKVRAAATRSLGAFAAQAFEPIRERLSDADTTVRMAAVGALVAADRERALSALGSLLDMTPTPAGVEAARVLATTEGEGAETARAFLRGALVSGDSRVRSQAAVALWSLPSNEALVPAIVEALAAETEPAVKRVIAGILAVRADTRDQALAALREMMEGRGMDAVQAAALLAQHEPAHAIPILTAAMENGEPEVRRTAARALARDALKPDAARTALRDDDPLVRIYAAGGILAAASALD